MDSEPALYVLDACCVINLLASGEAEAILTAPPFRFGVVGLVAEREILHIRSSPGDEDPAAPAEEAEITLEPLVQAGIVEILSPASPEEVATFVELALSLDDGEALSASLAMHRRALLVTDDLKALKVIAAVDPGVTLRRTSFLLKTWFEASAPGVERLRGALINVRQRGNFLPPRDDPEWQWWMTHLDGRAVMQAPESHGGDRG